MRAFKKSSNRLHRCRRDVIVHRCTENAEHSYITAFTCNDRFCPYCNNHYWRPRLKALVEHAVAADSYHPRDRLRHAVLTWRPHELTKANVRTLHAAALKWCKDLGFRWTVRALEISKKGFLHVHVLFPSPPISKRYLESRWRAVAGHSWIVRYKERPVTLKSSNHHESYRRLFGYLLTYATKSLPLADDPRVRRALSGTRRVAVTGELYGTAPAPHPKGCPHCGSRQRPSVMKLPEILDDASVVAVFDAGKDGGLAAAVLSRMMSDERLSEKGKAALLQRCEQRGLVVLYLPDGNIAFVEPSVKQISPEIPLIHAVANRVCPCAPISPRLFKPVTPESVMHLSVQPEEKTPRPASPHPLRKKPRPVPARKNKPGPRRKSPPEPPPGADTPHEHQPFFPGGI